MYPINLNIKTPWVDGQTKSFTEDSTTPPVPVGTAPKSGFSASPLTGTAPLIVKFTNGSTGTAPLTYKWDFSDGITNSGNAEQNPTRTFPTAKSYTITLIVTNAYGTDTATKVSYITATSPPTPTGMGCPTTVNGYAIGGGAGYPAYTSGVPGGSYNGATVLTRVQFLAAIAGAAAPAVIYIDPSADIDFTDERLVIPAGVIIASNRGVSGSLGGRLRTQKPGSNWGVPLFITGGAGVRFTGVRVQGECYAENYSDNESSFRVGLWLQHNGCVVDNCDFKGFGYANIMCWQVSQSGRPWIHHNYIHHSHNAHEGYGVNVEGGDALVEGNIFEHNRHHISAGGKAGEYYTFRYNKITDDTMSTVGRQAIDVHERETNPNVSGERYDIYNNTIVSGTACAVHVTSQPVGAGHYIYNNIFNCNPGGVGYVAAIAYTYNSGQPHGKMYATNNMWNGVLYPTNTTIVQYQG